MNSDKMSKMHMISMK